MRALQQLATVALLVALAACGSDSAPLDARAERFALGPNAGNGGGFIPPGPAPSGGGGSGGGSGTVSLVTGSGGSGVTVTVANGSSTPAISVSLSPVVWQEQVTGTCTAPNAIKSVGSDGTVACTTGVVNAGAAPISCSGGSCTLALCTNGSLYLEASGSWACTTVSASLDTDASAQGSILTRGASLWAAWLDVFSTTSGDIGMVASATPTTPTGTNLTVADTTVAGRQFLTTNQATGLPSLMNQEFAHRYIQSAMPSTNQTLNTIIGMSALTATGTATARGALASTSLYTSIPRVGYVSASSAGSVGGARYNILTLWRGNAAGLGGFHAVFRFAVSDAVIVTTGRLFVGLENNLSAPTDIEPSTMTNVFGVCAGSADTQLHMCESGAVAQSEIAINGGSGFPVNGVTNSDVYELILNAAPNDSKISWRIRDLTTGVDSGDQVQSTAANLFGNGLFMTMQYWRSNSTTAAAVGIDNIGYYAETDY